MRVQRSSVEAGRTSVDPSDQFSPIITGANLKVTDFLLSSRAMAEAEVAALQGRPQR